MRVLEVKSCPARFMRLVESLSRLLEVRGKHSGLSPSGCNAVPLETKIFAPASRSARLSPLPQNVWELTPTHAHV